MKNKKINFFIGPCVLESEEIVFKIAESLKRQLEPFEGKIHLHFKGSFDKANRTSIDSFRGPGLDKGLRLLEKVRQKFELPLITDYHLPHEAAMVAEVVDVLQIPAFLSRQTDMIISAARACKKFSRKLNIKKAQFMAAEDTKNIIDKATTILELQDLYLTERGTCFGYHNLVVDMASFQIMKSYGVQTIHDATHCVQRPGGGGRTSSGKKEFTQAIARAAVAAGADAIFFETHPNPDEALSDSATCFPLDHVYDFVSSLLKIYEVI